MDKKNKINDSFLDEVSGGASDKNKNIKLCPATFYGLPLQQRKKMLEDLKEKCKISKNDKNNDCDNPIK